MAKRSNAPQVAPDKPTPAAVWRKPRLEGYVVTLPSGNRVRLRPVALDLLILGGDLPDLLTPIAARSLWTETDVAAIADQVELAQGFAELVNRVVPLAVLEPEIVTDVPSGYQFGDDEIALDDIDFGDKLAIFQLATQPAAVLRSFREQQAAGVAALSDGQDGEPATE